VEKRAESNPAIPIPPESNRAAIALLDAWLADESGYDERVWPQVRDQIEEGRTSERARFGT